MNLTNYQLRESGFVVDIAMVAHSESFSAFDCISRRIFSCDVGQPFFSLGFASPTGMGGWLRGLVDLMNYCTILNHIISLS